MQISLQRFRLHTVGTKRAGFSLTELLVALVVAGILVALTTSVYNIFRVSLAKDTARANAVQNARIAVDRLSRELRQSPAVVTDLPNDPSDNSVAQPGLIEFEDGHANNLTYRRYYLNGTTLTLQIKEYYFASSPTTRVHWNQTGPGGTTPVSAVLSTQDIAEMVKSISFYGDAEVQTVITTGDESIQDYVLRTTVERRN